MRGVLAILDRYILRQSIGTLFTVLGIVMSLMILEHLPRLIEITRLSGHRGKIVIETMAGLLPEYAGIGLLVGLYLAIALAVRKLAMRGELDAIEATGFSPFRWMRMPIALTVVVALGILFNQGWLLPQGERRLDDIGRRMDAGEFGYKVQAKEVIDLGDGRALTFKGVSPDGTSLENVFLLQDDATYTAATGRISLAPDGGFIVRLEHGQSVDANEHRVASFDLLEFREAGRPMIESAEGPTDVFKDVSLTQLFEQGTPAALATAYGRILWALLALLTPVLGLSLGRPPRRSASAMSLFLGLVVVVSGIKSIDVVGRYEGAVPAVAALGVGAAWVVCAGALAWWNGRSGPGAFDQMIMRQVRRLPRHKGAKLLARFHRRHSQFIRHRPAGH